MINYQLEMDKLLENLTEQKLRPNLLLHSCCGPCSSYVLEYLCKFFDITVLFYNPNIFPQQEYLLRKSEQLRLIEIYKSAGRDIDFLDCDYDHSEFICTAKGLEKEKEGGARCRNCFQLRLEYAAKCAAEKGFSMFATTLTVSPHKNAPLINEIGLRLGEKHKVHYLASDFKKKSGYLRSIVLSKQYSLYRQHYCGCEFSINQEK